MLNAFEDWASRDKLSSILTTTLLAHLASESVSFGIAEAVLVDAMETLPIAVLLDLALFYVSLLQGTVVLPVTHLSTGLVATASLDLVVKKDILYCSIQRLDKLCNRLLVVDECHGGDGTLLPTPSSTDVE